MNLKELREAAERIARAAIKAVDPEALVYQTLKLIDDRLEISDATLDLSEFRRILVVGAGKAGATMARAVENTLGDRISDGIIVVKDGHAKPLKRIRILEASHPIPDDRGVEAARSIVALLEANASPDTLILGLISGGGSALLPLPREPVSLRDKQQITGLLLKCGATIDEINVVRKHLSGIKGGRLAQAAYPSSLFCLILSDVVGDSLSTIASGPTVGDPSTFSDCENVLKKYKIRQKASETVQKLIAGGIRGDFDETPKPGDKIFRRVSNVIIGSNRNALEAAAIEASSLGFNPLTLSTRMTGEAREVGTMLANKTMEICHTGAPVAPPACLLAGGETTVTIRGSGKGGRNQELALAAAIKLAEHPRQRGDILPDIVIAGIGTDGGDGPTDAAGAIVDTTTVERAERKGLDPVASLNQNDSYHLLGPIGDLLITGPTGTNVMDLMIALVG